MEHHIVSYRYPNLRQFVAQQERVQRAHRAVDVLENVRETVLSHQERALLVKVLLRRGARKRCKKPGRAFKQCTTMGMLAGSLKQRARFIVRNFPLKEFPEEVRLAKEWLARK